MIRLSLKEKIIVPSVILLLFLAIVMTIYSSYEFNRITNDFKYFLDDYEQILTIERNRFIFTIISIGLISIILSWIILMNVSTNITKPFKTLTKLVSEVTQGNLSLNIGKTEKSRDEISKLGSDVFSLIKQYQELAQIAQTASIAKSDFFANMSHEIRTQMNSILGFSELALDDNIPGRTREYISKILENTEGLLKIINDILDISRIESGKMKLEKIPFDMYDIFTGCRSIIMPKAAEKGLMLYFYAEPGNDKKLLGDTTRLRQVFINLLSNAIKFTETGTIKVISKRIDKINNIVKVYFEVKDGGEGMTDDQIEEIFEPFMQTETGTTKKHNSTGLGLYITKSIIELMGGQLSVESNPGSGTRFYFTIEFEEIDMYEEQVQRKKIELDDIKKPTFEGEILVCEDNAMNQQVICEHLARIGFKTVVAWNGKRGYEMVYDSMQKNRKQFDLILMDIYMPVMDGIEAAAKINEICADIPIVAITAKVFSNDLEIYEKSGMKDCINKPFTSQELWRCMTKYFDPIDNKNINTDVNDSDDEKSIEELEFLKKLKISFLRNCKNKYMEIIDALEKNDIKLAHRLAHGFKSNAGQIGKIHLQHAAMYIERHLKDGKNLVTPMQMTLFEKELNNTILQLHEELSPDTTQQEDNFYISNDITEFGDISEFNDTSKSKKSFGSSDSLDSKENINSDDDLSGNSSSLILLNKLELLLKTGNPECLKLANNIQNITCDEERKKKLIQQMDDFEFEEALFTLSEIKKMM